MVVKKSGDAYVRRAAPPSGADLDDRPGVCGDL